MGFGQSIKTGLAKSFQYSGRATRAEFWKFAPLGIAIGFLGSWISAAIVADGKPITLLFLAAFTFASFIPLTAAGSRRLQDSGANGHDIFLPIVPIIFAMLFFSVSYHIGFAIFVSFFAFPAIGLVAGIIYYFSLIAVLIVAPIVGLMFFGPVIGQLIVPSEPNTNRFGPNPNEVPS